MPPSATSSIVDVALIGAGIMSATTGTLLKELAPSLNMVMFERLENCALESSDGWNNAGTGHAANCELNYTPELSDGSVDISRALEVNVEFDVSRQLWTHLVRKGAIPEPAAFIRACPHMSFVVGSDNVTFLRKRFAAMSVHHCYKGMEHSESGAAIEQWAPLIMEGRDPSEPVAATRMITGADVDYGALTRLLVAQLEHQQGFAVHYRHEVVDIERLADGRWRIETKRQLEGDTVSTIARFVFIGAGGGALPLAQKAAFPEIHGYGGFPVSGVWLRCDTAGVAQRHHVKVYGKAAHGSPPMSVPHLDMRVVGRQHSILFGPYAGFSTKFLKHGSYLDLPKSIRASNLAPLVDVAAHSFRLEEYLVGQVVQTSGERFETLQRFYPRAQESDWHEAIAGQRVQIIKPDGHGGSLEFGTELVGAADQSIVALLGASPGASTAAFIAVEVLKKCFARRLTDADWLPRLKQIFPTYGIDLRVDADACRRTRTETASVLKLLNA